MLNLVIVTLMIPSPYISHRGLFQNLKNTPSYPLKIACGSHHPRREPPSSVQPCQKAQLLSSNMPNSFPTSGPLHVLCPPAGMPFLPHLKVPDSFPLSDLSSKVTSSEQPPPPPPCSPGHPPFPVWFPSQCILPCDLSMFIYLPFLLIISSTSSPEPVM